MWFDCSWILVLSTHWSTDWAPHNSCKWVEFVYTHTHIYIWCTQICYLSCELMLSLLKAGNCAQNSQLWLYMYGILMQLTLSEKSQAWLNSGWTQTALPGFQGLHQIINTVPVIGSQWHHQCLYDGQLLLNASFWAYNLCCMPDMRRRMDEQIVSVSQPPASDELKMKQ